METHEKQADPQKPEWLTYEEVASYLLNRFAHIFGLEFVEGKQNVQGQRSGTTWTIDGKGIAEGNEGLFIRVCEPAKPRPVQKPYSWLLEPYLQYLREEAARQRHPVLAIEAVIMPGWTQRSKGAEAPARPPSLLKPIPHCPSL